MCVPSIESIGVSGLSSSATAAKANPFGIVQRRKKGKAEEKVGGWGIGFETCVGLGGGVVRERLWGIWLKTVQLKNR